MMKVKVGQLKAHLSHYVRSVQENQEPIEVCVREKPVAYLIPIRKQTGDASGLDEDLMDRLRASGITATPPRRPKGDWTPRPGRARDGREPENTVVAMRGEKAW